MYTTPEDFDSLVRALEKMKPSAVLSPAEQAHFTELSMEDLWRRYWEAWTMTCRRSITRLMRLRESMTDPALIRALDQAVERITALASSI